MLTSAVTFGPKDGANGARAGSPKPAATEELICGSDWCTVSHARMARKGRRTSPSPEPRVPTSRATIGSTKARGVRDLFENMPSAATTRKHHPEKAHLSEADKADLGVSDKHGLWRKLPGYSQCGNYLAATGRSNQSDERKLSCRASQTYQMHMSASAGCLFDVPGTGIETPSMQTGSESGDQNDRRSPGLNRERYNKNTATLTDVGVVQNSNIIASSREALGAVANVTNGGGDSLLHAAEKKLAEWRSFKERHRQELQTIIQHQAAPAVAGKPSPSEKGDASSLEIREPVGDYVASTIWSMRVPDKRRDAKCPIRAASMTDLSLQKSLATYGVHPVAPRHAVAATGPQARRYHQAPAQWKY